VLANVHRTLGIRQCARNLLVPLVGFPVIPCAPGRAAAVAVAVAGYCRADV